MRLSINGPDRATPSLRKAPHPQTPAIRSGVKLIGLALLNMAFQLAILEGGQFVFYENPRLSRAVHAFFSGADGLTPALRRLREYYWQPINGVDFSQAFSIYLIMLASLGFYFVLLCVLALRGQFNNVNWRLWTRRDFSLMALLGGIGVAIFVEFFWGPSAMNERFRFGGSFISSLCVYLPFAQFLILLVLALYFTAGISLPAKPNDESPTS